MVQKTCRHDTVMHGDPMPDPPASLNGARVVLVEDQQQPRPVPALLVSAFSEQQVPRLPWPRLHASFSSPSTLGAWAGSLRTYCAVAPLHDPLRPLPNGDPGSEVHGAWSTASPATRVLRPEGARHAKEAVSAPAQTRERDSVVNVPPRAQTRPISSASPTTTPRSPSCACRPPSPSCSASTRCSTTGTDWGWSPWAWSDSATGSASPTSPGVSDAPTSRAKTRSWRRWGTGGVDPWKAVQQAAWAAVPKR
jgi:hypothetical protein